MFDRGCLFFQLWGEGGLMLTLLTLFAGRMAPHWRGWGGCNDILSAYCMKLGPSKATSTAPTHQLVVYLQTFWIFRKILAKARIWHQREPLLIVIRLLRHQHVEYGLEHSKKPVWKSRNLTGLKIWPKLLVAQLLLDLLLVRRVRCKTPKTKHCLRHCLTHYKQ